MKVFLAGLNDDYHTYYKCDPRSRYNLISFAYKAAWHKELILNSEMFFLDSGAFTFLNKGLKNFNIDDYVDRYIDYINTFDIKYFFELDIDSVVGYKKVKEIRRKIERKTQKKCIPVYHKSRGEKEFHRLCKEYDYIAIGGIVTREFTKTNISYLIAIAI